MPAAPAPMLLATTIRPYEWGSVTALPDLFGVAPTGLPQAELWVGAHPAAPSSAGGTPLPDLIAADPHGMLGTESAARFGSSLPYLLKVLAVERPLSLQVHPSAAGARAGFAAEQARGIPLGDRARTYKDPHHKPEMVCAVTRFHGLCGFREPAAAADHLESLAVPGLEPWIGELRAGPSGRALRSVFTQMLDERAAPVRAEVERSLASRHPESVHAGIARDHPGDPGVLASLLLDHFVLEPGEALFLDAGVPHSYLGGLAVEIMANSDNVLRCGLTPKHVDVAELVRVVDFVPAALHRVEPKPGPDGEVLYRPPAAEFALVRHDLSGAPHVLPRGWPQAVLCLDGEVALAGGPVLRPGDAAFVPADAPACEITGKGTLYRALPGIGA
ncbi:mannose-6-phosphate isomerase, class I [Actinomadura roseirufa]|uniref:mannose-6-phosphate isomerase, class I n=1 Tax=Actinomadura roseirufa TaxID=2094049 RepID=UPI001F5F9B32|nr:mannose-6-phosphate isomerase, class I [Actinomadura roseirufa]